MTTLVSIVLVFVGLTWLMLVQAEVNDYAAQRDHDRNTQWVAQQMHPETVAASSQESQSNPVVTKPHHRLRHRHRHGHRTTCREQPLKPAVIQPATTEPQELGVSPVTSNHLDRYLYSGSDKGQTTSALDKYLDGGSN